MTHDQLPRRARIVVVDDHDLARAGLRSMLAGEPDLEVVGEAANGREARELCRRLRPDLVLTDVRMPDLDGLAATRAIKQDSPATRVVIVTLHDDARYFAEAVSAGAAGYLLKDATRRQVLATVRQVLRGETPLIAGPLAQRLQRAPEMTTRPGGAPERLTPREQEVLTLVARGRTNREIARGLGVSVGTVKIHVARVIAKLDAADRTEAAVRAIELGLVSRSRE